MSIVSAISRFAGLRMQLRPRGTYTDANGAVILELRSGGNANFTFMGDVQDCSYKSSDKQLTLSCKSEAGNTVFNLHDDGSLTGPPGASCRPCGDRKAQLSDERANLTGSTAFPISHAMKANYEKSYCVCCNIDSGRICRGLRERCQRAYLSQQWGCCPGCVQG